MIVYSKPLYLGVVWDAEAHTYKSLATEETSAVVRNGDRVLYPCGDMGCAEVNEELKNVIVSLDQVKALVKGKLMATWDIAVVSWVVLIVATISAVNRVMGGAEMWPNVCLVALFMFVAAVYTSQAMRPVVHDVMGHRINLRSGDSNFHGGCRIRKSASWEETLSSYYIGSSDAE